MQSDIKQLDICDGTENLPIYYVCDGKKTKSDITEVRLRMYLS